MDNDTLHARSAQPQSIKLPSEPSCLQAALRYLHRGWSVVVLNGITDKSTCTCGNPKCTAPGKHPIGSWKHLQHQRMTEENVRRMFAAHPNANIGIVTGAVSGNLCVLDIDGQDGIAALQEAGIELGVSEAPIVRTGRRGGAHVYLSAGTTRIGNFAGKLRSVDGRAEGGYVVAPPSRHASGAIYQFMPGTEELAPPLASEDVLRLFQNGASGQQAHPASTVPQVCTTSPVARQFTPDRVIGAREVAYAERALHGECATIRSAPIGQQEATLNKAALKVGHLVGAGAIDEDSAIRALTAAGQGMRNDPDRMPWEPQDIERKVCRGVQDGARQPFDFSRFCRFWQ